MRIENTVEVDAPLDRVWALVNDIPRVAPCMPGGALTGVLDDKTYEGTVAVKLGPLRMSYKGKVVVEEVDEANHRARLGASGRDTKGAGTARASVETRLEPAGDHHTRLHVTSDVQLTGKVASFGRGGAINDVATRLFGQFADCLRATLEAEPSAAEAAAVEDRAASGPAGTAAEAAPGAATPAAATADVPASPAAAQAPTAQAPTAPASTAGPAATPSAPAATPAPRPAATPAPRSAKELDAGSLVGTVIKGRLRAWGQAIANFFRRLFGRRRPSG
jgi:carbon monoxide dehydrogenase subunit G